MAVVNLYAKTTGDNWDSANGFNTQADGLGTDYTNPQNGADTYICNLNGKNKTANLDIVVDQITATGATGQLTASGTMSITAFLNYGGTLSTGMVVNPTGVALTVVGNVTASSSASAIVSAGTATLTVTGDVLASGANTAINHGGSGVLTITGDVSCTNSSGRGVGNTSTNANSVITGNISASAGYGLRAGGGTTTVNGNLSKTVSGTSIFLAGGTVIWTGARSLADTIDAYISISTGTLNITSLVLSCTGRFVIDKTGGTITTGSGATLAQINLMSAAAQATILGQAVTVTPFSTGSGGDGGSGFVV